MIWNRPTDKGEDLEMRAIFRRHDYAAPPSDLEQAILESRIMAKINALPDPSIPADAFFMGFGVSKQWVLGGVATGVLFVMLGFGVGRAFDNLFSTPDDSTPLFAAADTTPWPPLVFTPASTEDGNDVSQ